MVVSLAWLSYFLPIIAFLFVFLIIYAVLQKTEILGNQFVNVFISFLIASFFILNVSLVDFVNVSTSWVAVGAVALFLIMLIVGMLGKDSLKVFSDTKWLAWVVIGILIVILLVSASYVFNWAVNWDLLNEWVYADWFGFVLLVIIGVVMAIVLSKKAK